MYRIFILYTCTVYPMLMVRHSGGQGRDMVRLGLVRVRFGLGSGLGFG